MNKNGKAAISGSAWGSKMGFCGTEKQILWGEYLLMNSRSLLDVGGRGGTCLNAESANTEHQILAGPATPFSHVWFRFYPGVLRTDRRAGWFLCGGMSDR